MPVIRTFMYVQVNFHVMNFILGSLLLYKDRQYLSALILALAIHFKASPAVLVLAFLLEFNWRWLAWFVVHMILIAGLTTAIYGIRPYVDFINNFLFLNAPHGLSLYDSSFDSAIGITLSYFRADPFTVRLLVLLAKGVIAIVTVFLSIRSRGFSQRRKAKSGSMTPSFPCLWQ